MSLFYRSISELMLTSRKRIFWDQLQTVRLYYQKPKFALIDLTFFFIGLFINPYRTCRKFLQKKGAANIYAYGETPFTTYQKMVDECGIGPDDVWVEMGSGRGKGCFWLSQFIKCKVVGIEWIPQFVFFSNMLRKIFRVKNLSFQRVDMQKADIAKATVIYLYGNFPQVDIPLTAKVISISAPLEGFTVLKTFWVRYPWGRTAAFLQKR